MCAVCTEGWYHICLICVPRAWGGPWLRGGLSELSLTVGVGGSVCSCTVRGHCRLQVRGQRVQGCSSRVGGCPPGDRGEYSLPSLRQASKGGDSGDPSQPHQGAHILGCPLRESPAALELYWAS